MDLDKLAKNYAEWYQTPRGKYVGANEYACLAGHAAKIEYKKVIEIGCGTGFFLRRFARQADYAVGFDLTERMLEKARSLAAENNIAINFIKGDAREKLPFASSEFDLVYSNSMIEFIKDENILKKTLAEMWRILKPGGLFLIGVLNRNSSWADQRIAESQSKETFFKESKFYTWQQLETLLLNYGKPEIESTLFVPPYFRKEKDLNWFRPLEAEYKKRFPDRGALLVGSVMKKED